MILYQASCPSDAARALYCFILHKAVTWDDSSLVIFDLCFFCMLFDCISHWKVQKTRTHIKVNSYQLRHYPKVAQTPF